MMMTKKVFELWLIWQNVETRQRYHIGRLKFKDGLFTFNYETKGYRRKLAEVMDHGYLPHLAFPDIYGKYTSRTLFGPFSRRLPDPRRPDYKELMEGLGLTVNSTELDVLRATGGLLATDSYEFVEPILVENNHFSFDLFIAGWRYYDGESVIGDLKVDNPVIFALDLENPEDDKAVKIYSADNVVLGYIPAFYSEWIFEAIERDWFYHAKIDQVHQRALPHRKVSINVQGMMTPYVGIEDVFKRKEKLQMVEFV